LTATETYSNNYTKGTPIIQADILGDWREEVAWRTTDNKYIRLYSTTYQTPYRIPTLMQEPQYRLAVAWQNNSYNQPPHTSIYLAAEMQDNFPYPISNNKVIWNTGANWDINSSLNWKDEDDKSIVFQDGDDVLFDLTGDNSESINITTTISPRTLTFTSPGNYEFTGAGSLSSDMALYKTGIGKLTINNTNDYDGVTKVLDGQLILNGELSASHVEVGMFGELYANGVFGNGIHVKSDGEIQIGATKNGAGHAIVTGDLKLDANARIYFDLSPDTTGESISNDKIIVSDNLILGKDIMFEISALEDSLTCGNYELIRFSGTSSGKINRKLITGIEGTPFKLFTTDTSLILQVIESREETRINWKGNFDNGIWNRALTKNWSLDNDSTWFLDRDTVIFNNHGLSHNTVDIQTSLFPSKVEVNSSGNYTFAGSGEISGSCTLEKSGSGKLFIQNKNSYTGNTMLKNGTIEVETLGNTGKNTYLGFAENNSNTIIFDGGTLSISSNESTTNRNLSFPGDGNIYIGAGKELTINSELSGIGKMNKTGLGKVILTNSNTIEGGITIKKGEIYLENENAITHGLGSGPVTIENGTLSLYNNVLTNSTAGWDIIIPAMYTASLKTDSRCNFTGRLSGEGNLNLYLPGDFTELQGDWSEYNGKITVSTDSVGGRLLLANNKGYGKTSFHLNDKTVAIFRNSTSDTIEIGALSGDIGSELGAGGTNKSTITWKIGGNNSSFSFKGLLSDKQYTNSGAISKIIKTGTGEMKITNDNTYSGGTIVEKGTLIIANSNGSATGTGKVVIRNGGTLSGSGYSKSPVVVEKGTISPGISGIGVLTIINNIDMNEDSYYLSEINTNNLTSDLLVVAGEINLNGTLYLSISGANGFSENDSIKILNAGKINGDFKTILPSNPKKGLEWNISTLKSDGYLRVRKEGSTHMNKTLNEEQFGNIYPNPANGEITIQTTKKIDPCYIEVRNIMGQTVFYEEFPSVQNKIELDLSHLNSGTYIVQISDDSMFTQSMLILE
jgi:autotransporter-associated beta strand protein